MPNTLPGKKSTVNSLQSTARQTTDPVVSSHSAVSKLVKQKSSLVKIGEASKLLGVSIDTLRRWEKKGWIKAVKTPGGTRFYDISLIKKINPALGPGRKYGLPAHLRASAPEQVVQPISQIYTKPLAEDLSYRGIDANKQVKPQNLVTDLLNRKIDAASYASIDPHAFHSHLTRGFHRHLFITAILALAATASILSALLTTGLIASYFIKPEQTKSVFSNLANKQVSNEAKSSLAQSFTSSIAPLLSPFNNLAVGAINTFAPSKASELGLLASVKDIPRDLALDLTNPEVTKLEGEVLAESTPSGTYLLINLDTKVAGSLDSSTLHIANDASIDGPLTLNTVTYNYPSAQGTANTFLQNDGAGTLSWTEVPLPDTASTTIAGIASFSDSNFAVSTAGLVTIKSGGVTTTEILDGTVANADLANSKLTVTAGSGLSGGGDVSLGSSVTLSSSLGTSVDLTSEVTGVLPIANGGSAKALTVAAGGILWTDSDSFEVSAAGTSGQCLTSAGTSAPTWGTCGGTISGTANTITKFTSSSAIGDSSITDDGSTVTVTVAGSFSTTLGVTGISTFTGNVNANGGLDIDDAFVVADGGALTTSQTSIFNGTVTVNAATALNDGAGDFDFTVKTDSNASALILDAGLFSGVGQFSIGSAAQSTATAFTVIDNPAITATSNQNFYKAFIDNNAAVTITGATTSSLVASLAIDEPNITATGAVTNAATLYLSGAPTEGGSGNFAVWVDNGESRFENTPVSGSTTGSALTVVPAYVVEAADITLSGLRVALDTNSNGDSGDIAYGVNIDDITTAAGPTEYALRVGTGYDYPFFFDFATRDLRLSVVEPSAGTSPLTLTVPSIAADDSFCIRTLGNCFGAGSSGVTYTSQTTNALTKFTATAGEITSAGLLDDGSTFTFSANRAISMTAGTGSFTQTYQPSGSTGTANAHSITSTFGIDATDQTLSGIFIDADTNSNTDTGDILYGVNIDTITASSASEYGLGIGSGWDSNIYLNDTTSRVLLADGGTIVIHDGTNTLCTVTDSGTTGDLTCTGNITGGSSGTSGFWSRSGTTLSPATANDIVSIATTNTSGADLAITNTGIYTGTGIFNLTANSATSGILASITANGLTSGKMLSLSSTSTVLTGTAGIGSLANLDWSPGSATTATGDLFALNIGTNGTTTGNLFNILDTGSSIFSVSETQFTTSLPSQFNSAGDVEIAYDLNFTNPTASYINSLASLTLKAGEPFNSSDLTLQTYNQGTIVFNTATTTGTSLDYTNSTLTTGTGFSLTSSNTSQTTATVLGITQSGVTTGYTGNLINISSTSTTGAATFFNLAADSSTVGTLMALSGNALTTGIGLAIDNGTSAMTTGSLLRVTAGGTGVIATNGIVGITHSGAYTSTSNAGLLNVTATGLVGTGTVVNIGASNASQVSDTILNVAQTGVTTGYTGTAISFSTTATTGSGAKLLDLAANAMTVGTVASLSGTALTTGTNLALTMGSALTTGSAFTVSSASYNHSAGETGSVVSLAFTDATTNAVTSTTNGLLISPTINAGSGAATRTINGISVAPAFTSCAAGTCEVNGVNIGNVTDGTGFTGTALKLGSGWDDAININSSALIAETTGQIAIDPTTTGTLLDYELATQWTTGTVINADFASATSLSGNITGINIDFATNVTPGAGRTIKGVVFDLPDLTQSSAVTSTYDGIVIDNSLSTLQQDTAAGTINWRGLAIQMPFQYQNTGTVTSTGLNLAMGSFGTNGGTKYGINIDPATTGTTNGIQYAINIGNAGGGATDTAINFGTGWDTEIALTDTTPTVSIGNTGTLAFTDGTNTLCSIADAGTTGNLTCTGNITGSSSGTAGYWSRASTTLSPATANDIVSIATTNTTGADFAITNTGVYTGTGIFNLTADSATTGTILALSADGLTTGKAIDLTSTSNAWDSGTLLNVSHSATAATDTTLSADIANLSFSPTYSTAVTTPAISGNVLDIARTTTTSALFASTLTVSGALVSIADTSTATTGTITHTANVLDVTQNYTSSSGTALYVKNYGGASSASFRVDDVSGDTAPFLIDAEGDVLIGTTTQASAAELTVAGDIVQVDGSGNVVNSLSNSGSYHNVFNEQGSDVDFRIESDNLTHMFFIDASVDRIGIGDDTTPDALLELSSSDTDGGDFLITNTGIGLSGTVASIVSNATTTGDILTISSTALTTGSALTLTGPTSTGVTDHFIKATADIGSAASLLNLNPDFSGAGVTGYGIYNVATDSTASANTDYLDYGSLALTGNVGKTAYGLYRTITSTSTTAESAIYGADILVDHNAAVTSGNKALYGLRSQITNDGITDASSGTHNSYAGYFSATGNTGDTNNGYGIYATTSGFDNNYAGYFSLANTGQVYLDATLASSRIPSALTITQADGAGTQSNSLVQITNNDSDSTGYSLSIGNQGTNSGIQVTGNALGTGLSITGAFTTGTGISLPFGLSSITSGKIISITGSAENNSAFTGDVITVSSARTTSSGTNNDTGNFLDISRANTTSGTAALTVSGDLASLSSSCTVSAGSCTDTGDILQLTQSYASATGSVLNIINSGAGTSINAGNGTDLLQVSSVGDITFVDADGAASITGPAGGYLNITAGSGQGLGFTASTTTGTTSSSAFTFTNNSLTSGTGGYFSSTSITQGKLLQLSTGSSNTLTTGTLFDARSTATSLTGAAGTGSLINLDWSPGSATTAAGDLFALNIGTNGTTTGSLFNILDASASIFSVKETQFETSLPSNFTAAGDVSVAYDLAFTNPTASYITSVAPMTIRAGESFNSSNLTLSTYNFGTVIVDSSVTTGTGTKYNFSSTLTDSTANANTDVGINSTVTLTGNIAKTAYGVFSTITSTSTVGDTLQAGRFLIDHNAATASGNKSLYGVVGQSDNSGVTDAAGTHLVYGGWFQAIGNAGGTSTSYGVYASASGADTNYPFYMATAPVSSGTAALCWDASGDSPINDCSGAPVVDYAEIYPTENSMTFGEIAVVGSEMVPSFIYSMDQSSNAQFQETKMISKLVKSSTQYQRGIIGITSNNYGDFTSTGHGSVRNEDHPLPVALSGRVPLKVSTENGAIQPGDYITTSSITGVGMKATRPGQMVGKALAGFNGNGVGTVMVFVNIVYADPNDALASLFLDDQGQMITQSNFTNLIVSSDINAGGIVKASDFMLDASSINLVGSLAGVQSDTEGKVNLAEAINAINDERLMINDKIATQSAQIASLDQRQASDSAVLAETKQKTDSLADAVNSTSSTLTSLSDQIQSLLDSFGGTSEATSSSEPVLTDVGTMFATGSATLADLKVTSEATISGNLTAYTATIQDTFKSLGNTFLGHTTVAGDLTVDGTLSITEGSKINALPILYFQDSPLANGVDFFNGKITVNNSGVLAAESLAIGPQTLGTGIITAGQTELTIPAIQVKTDSKIFLTATSNISGNLVVGTITPGSKFKVKLTQPNLQDVTFNWWIVQSKQALN